MGQVSASSTVLIDAAPETVLAAVADYQTVRPKILSSHYSDYQVLAGRPGRRAPSRPGSCRPPSRGCATCKADVDVAGHTVIEKDANSSMVTNWTVAPAGAGSSVTVKTQLAGRGRRRGLLREDVRAAGPEEDSGRGAGQPQEASSKTHPERGRQRPIRRLIRPRGLVPEEAGDAADHGVGVLLPAVGARRSTRRRRDSSCCRARPGSTGTEPG